MVNYAENTSTMIITSQPTATAQIELSHPIANRPVQVMKSPIKNRIVATLALCAILSPAIRGYSQITVKVDSTKNWVGYMNWYSTNNVYVAGGAWGFADLRSKFVPYQSNAAHLILQINNNTVSTNGYYWNLADGTPNKLLEANSYVDVGASFAGNDVTFQGTVESNSLPAGWTCSAVIKHFNGNYGNYGGMTATPIVGGSPFSVTRTIPLGGICQYGFMLYGPNTPTNSPNSLQAVSINVDTPNPAVVADPVDARAVLGGKASFTVAAVGSPSPAYYWKRYGTNLLNSAKFSGVNTPTLTVSNVTFADAATNYTVVVSNVLNAVNSRPAKLTVLTPDQFANALDNSSFELNYDAVNAFQVVPSPWINFSGSALLSEGDFPWAAPVEGTNVVQVYNGGQYNGIYQDVPASPGDIFTGDGWMFQSQYTALSAPTNEAYLEVQFRQGNNPPIAIYQSCWVTNTPTMQDAWMFLQVTNGVPAGYASTSTTNAAYLVAPAGTDHVRYQVTLHAEGVGNGSVYVDVMRLMKKIPVTVTASISGGNINLSWMSQGATSYQVVYKDNIADASWTTIGGLIAGDGGVKTASFLASPTKRFYSVLTK